MMQLHFHINDTTQTIDVPDFVILEAEDFFAQIDRDLDRGYQMSRLWVQHPNQEQRCQIVADKILTAFTNGNQKIVTLLSGYILNRRADTHGVHMNIEGDMTGHEFY